MMYGALSMHDQELPIPDFYDSNKLTGVWRVPYQAYVYAARPWTPTRLPRFSTAFFW